MEFNNAMVANLATLLQDSFGFATKAELNLAVTEVIKRGAAVEAGGRAPSMSVTKLVRGLRIMAGGPPLSRATADADVAYVRALSTETSPGQYLVPSLQSNTVIQFLSIGGRLRAAGARVWPMGGAQKLNVPVELTAPTWEWLGQNTAQSASDPDFTQMPFDLKERRCLVAIPNQLLATSSPSLDSILSEMIGIAAGAHEDTAWFSTTDVAGAPKSIYANGNASSLFVGGSAAGGNLSYGDLLATMAKAYSVGASAPFVWIMSPRTWFNRCLGMTDLQSRPIVIPATVGLYGAIQWQLLGFPVFVTPKMSEAISNSTGTNQSWLLFTNPSYMHIAQDDGIQFAVSVDRYFELNQTALRATQHLDGGIQPAAGAVILKGIN